MKSIITLLIVLISFTAYSQDPFLQKSSTELDEKASEITELYNREVVLTSKQQLLFSQKVEEFLIRRKKIESEFSGKEKLDLLVQLQNEETLEMGNILTRPQLNVYKKIKPSIQPLDIVEKAE